MELPTTSQIFVKLVAGDLWALDVNLDNTVMVLKEKIHELVGIPCQVPQLVLFGRQLEDSKILHESKVHKGCTIHLLFRFLGGMLSSSVVPNPDAQSSPHLWL